MAVKSVLEQLCEAAGVDGADWFQKISYINCCISGLTTGAMKG
jgi:ABC-type polysaccharide transport system permease subunit